MRKLRAKEIEARALSEELIGAEPDAIARAARSLAQPVAAFVGFSGGDDSLVTAHWCMNNVPGCRIFHANTGIGIERTREFVRGTCAKYGWPLVEIRAKEDCGQDYDAMVLEHGFPGPSMHSIMYRRLKERCVQKLLRDHKTQRHDNIVLFAGIRKDESERRSGYAYTVMSWHGNTLWASALYYKPKSWFRDYIARHGLARNPVAVTLGMSGECLCGAYAHAGELALIKTVCPATHARIRALEEKARAAGHDWGWEDAPPKSRHKKTRSMFMPMCVGCEKQDAN